MKTPSIEKIEKHFENAKTIKCIADKLPYDISNLKLVQNNELGDKFYSFDDENDSENYCVCFTKEKGCAKILSYKNEYKITKEQILEIEQWGNKSDAKKVREWYPDCFKKELIVGRWYKNSIDSLLYCKNIEEDGCISGYGFNQFGQWVDDYAIIPEYTEATPKEVEDALIKEAKRRYPIGTHIKCLHNGFGIIKISSNIDYYFESNDMYYAGCQIFKQGIWCDTMPKKKMTISEIEEKLGFEIEIV